MAFLFLSCLFLSFLLGKYTQACGWCRRTHRVTSLSEIIGGRLRKNGGSGPSFTPLLGADKLLNLQDSQRFQTLKRLNLWGLKIRITLLGCWENQGSYTISHPTTTAALGYAIIVISHLDYGNSLRFHPYPNPSALAAQHKSDHVTLQLSA